MVSFFSSQNECYLVIEPSCVIYLRATSFYIILFFGNSQSKKNDSAFISISILRMPNFFLSVIYYKNKIETSL